MFDEREILKKGLIKLGIDNSKANIIAVDAGSSQCIVNKLYLEDLGVSPKLMNKALKLVVLFYIEELD
jgi:hypothetical protein